MTREETDRLAVLIAAHWPAPVLTPVDRAALHRSLGDLSFADAIAAVDRLVREGREFQPRAPAVLAAAAAEQEERAAGALGRGSDVPLHPAAQAAQDRLEAEVRLAAERYRRRDLPPSQVGRLLRRLLAYRPEES